MQLGLVRFTGRSRGHDRCHGVVPPGDHGLLDGEGCLLERLSFVGVLAGHRAAARSLLHHVGELMGEELLTALAGQRGVGGEVDLAIAGEGLGVDRVGLGCSARPLVHGDV